jgi:bifunctional non-homologous end joining protein LigD
MRELAEYNRKRKFQETSEPVGRVHSKSDPIFVVQRHAASRLHFDFRLQVDGALASWAVPKGPPQEKGEKRLAIHVEDHPIEYAKFEGDIPKGNYGAGHVDIWDKGTFEVEGTESAALQIEKGDLKFTLKGDRLNGRYALVKMRNSSRGNEWLFIRKSDPTVDAGRGEERQRTPAKNGNAATSKTHDPAALEGSKKAPFPSEVPVALAQLSDKPFSDPAWLFEIKWDGERALAFVRDGKVELRARSGRNITSEYPELKAIVKQLNARQAVVDGEIVVLDEDGRSDFTKIQPRFGVTNPPLSLQQKSPATYYAYDLLYCDGYDIRDVPLEQRKDLLLELLRTSENIRYSDHVMEKGLELLKVAKERGLEGIIAKRRDSRYVGTRSSLWLKFKIIQDMDVVIGGWTEPRRTRDHFGALLMGLYDGKRLKYIGNVGTGFDREMLARTMKTLQSLAQRDSPFDTNPKAAEPIHWVQPKLVARVKYGQWTKDLKLRQPVFLGFQEDCDAHDCRMEEEVSKEDAPLPKSSPAKKGTRRAALVDTKRPRENGTPKNGPSVPPNLEEELARGKGDSLNIELDGKKISLTHLNKMYFTKPDLRKRDVLLYYLRVAPYILPFLKDCPLVLKRYPNGIDDKFFFQKEAPASRPEWLKTAMIYSDERKAEMPYVLAEDRADLLYLTNLGCIDHNPWSSRFDDETHPDYVFFDLDPTTGTFFETVVTVAKAIYERLEKLSVKSYLKASGASGFHIYVPLEPKYTYEQVRLFAGAIGQQVKGDLPDVVTFERKVRSRRKGTVLFDAVQNARGKPLAAPYSLRPFHGAPVSTPVSAKELTAKLRPESLNIVTIFERLERSGDLWKDFWKNRQKLEDVVK